MSRIMRPDARSGYLHHARARHATQEAVSPSRVALSSVISLRI